MQNKICYANGTIGVCLSHVNLFVEHISFTGFDIRIFPFYRVFSLDAGIFRNIGLAMKILG